MIDATGWVDTHCHLDSLDDAESALAEARTAGVTAMVTVGTDLASSHLAVRDAGLYPGVRAAVGVHPHEADSFDQSALETIQALAKDPGVVAIGEIGLDFYRIHSSVERQQKAFRIQLDLAKQCGKPVILHIRDAYPEALELLEKSGPPPKLVFHCFSGSEADAGRALALGACISFAGNITYKKSEALREAAKVIPLSRLLIETDAPYLAPVPYRGKPNQPAYVAEVGRALAEIRGESAEEIARATTATAGEVFSL